MIFRLRRTIAAKPPEHKAYKKYDETIKRYNEMWRTWRNLGEHADENQEARELLDSANAAVTDWTSLVLRRSSARTVNKAYFLNLIVRR